MLQTVTRESFGERVRRRLSNLKRRMSATAHYFRTVKTPAGVREPRILTITADPGFYSCVLSATQACGWNAEWARSMNKAVEICRTRITPIVIFDRNLPDVDWRRAVDLLSSTAYEVRILLAAPDVDEDLWRSVIQRHGYDVLDKSAGPEQLQRDLQFAWLSLDESMHPKHAVTPLLSRG